MFVKLNAPAGKFPDYKADRLHTSSFYLVSLFWTRVTRSATSHSIQAKIQGLSASLWSWLAIKDFAIMIMEDCIQ